MGAAAVVIAGRRVPCTHTRQVGMLHELPIFLVPLHAMQDDSNTTLADLLGTGSTLPRQQRGSRFQAVDLSRVPSSRVMTEQEDTAPELPGCMTG